MGFIAGLRAEFTKVFTTRLWWVLALVMIVYLGALTGGLGTLFAGLQTGAIRASAGHVPRFGDLAPPLYSFATSIGYVFPILFGALLTAGEWRHQTITPTFLANPHRYTVLWAKIWSAVVFGAAYGAVAVATSAAGTVAALQHFGVDTELHDAATWHLFARAVLAMALWGFVGVGLGVLVPNQAAVIVTVLAFTQFVEPLLRLASAFSSETANAAKFLPGAASDALVGASFLDLQNNAEGTIVVAQLDGQYGGLMLVIYGAAVTVIGCLTTWRRDVS
ncbi:ABC transporter permease [Gryllotalpicola koreensis]|uniref:ABC transporter permease n=1 Tax=Gryllotalpicola koreensis TaxID=993086 RepID=A0ABP7ZTQ6_9MICO